MEARAKKWFSYKKKRVMFIIVNLFFLVNMCVQEMSTQVNLLFQVKIFTVCSRNISFSRSIRLSDVCQSQSNIKSK